MPKKSNAQVQITPGTTEVTSASAWRAQTLGGTPLRVPSGNVCLIKESSGLHVFVQNGSIPNALMPLIDEAMKKGKPPESADLSLEKNPDLLNDIVTLCDTVTLSLVLKPVVKPIPYLVNSEGRVARDPEGKPIVLPSSQRETGDFIYVDEVDFEDKMFIFNYAVGGTTDLERFRQELNSSMESVPASKDVGN
jgi:hypothetical protein